MDYGKPQVEEFATNLLGIPLKLKEITQEDREQGGKNIVARGSFTRDDITDRAFNVEFIVINHLTDTSLRLVDVQSEYLNTEHLNRILSEVLGYSESELSKTGWSVLECRPAEHWIKLKKSTWLYDVEFYFIWSETAGVPQRYLLQDCKFTRGGLEGSNTVYTNSILSEEYGLSFVYKDLKNGQGRNLYLRRPGRLPLIELHSPMVNRFYNIAYTCGIRGGVHFLMRSYHFTL